jgi:hypothetical protein
MVAVAAQSDVSGHRVHSDVNSAHLQPFQQELKE